MVFSAVNKLSVVEQVIELPTVDLVKGDVQTEVRVTFEQVTDIECGQQVQSRILTILSSHHSVSLSTSSLAVGETSGLCSLERALYQRLHTHLVYLYPLSKSGLLLTVPLSADSSKTLSKLKLCSSMYFVMSTLFLYAQ